MNSQVDSNAELKIFRETVEQLQIQVSGMVPRQKLNEYEDEVMKFKKLLEDVVPRMQFDSAQEQITALKRELDTRHSLPDEATTKGDVCSASEDNQLQRLKQLHPTNQKMVLTQILEQDNAGLTNDFSVLPRFPFFF